MVDLTGLPFWVGKTPTQHFPQKTMSQITTVGWETRISVESIDGFPSFICMFIRTANRETGESIAAAAKIQKPISL